MHWELVPELAVQAASTAAGSLLLGDCLGDLLLGCKVKLFVAFSLFSFPMVLGELGAFNEELNSS